jgi:hypothetical protein
MTYDDLIASLQTFLEIPLNQTDENFQRVIPRIMEDANNRIYRELDFLPATTSQTAALTANVRVQTLPPSVIVLDSVNVITPLSAQPDDAGATRHPVERISIEAMDIWYPQASFAPGVPTKYSLIGAPASTPPYNMRLWPEPAQAYNAEFIGVIRPAPPGPTTQNTYLLTTYPELFLAACMVLASGYQRDFGAMADDPQKAMSWEAHYSTLRTTAMIEGARIKGEGAQWTAKPPAPVAAQPRERAGP